MGIGLELYFVLTGRQGEDIELGFEVDDDDDDDDDDNMDR